MGRLDSGVRMVVDRRVALTGKRRPLLRRSGRWCLSMAVGTRNCLVGDGGRRHWVRDFWRLVDHVFRSEFAAAAGPAPPLHGVPSKADLLSAVK
jgi:hypothetical protein